MECFIDLIYFHGGCYSKTRQESELFKHQLAWGLTDSRSMINMFILANFTNINDTVDCNYMDKCDLNFTKRS